MVIKLKRNRVWRTYHGGERIDRLQGLPCSGNGHFPEEWVASVVEACNPGREQQGEGLSCSEDGQWLKLLIDQDPVRYLGEEQVQRYGGRMSILVKLLDAAERLVIQAHPTVSFAKAHFHSDFGKTESWYIVEADEGAHVYLGFRPGITRSKWEESFWSQDISGMLELMHKLPVRPGDMIFVDGGVPHAIGGGCLLVELQEPTDLMVVPERVTPSGTVLPESRLHGGLGFERMFDCFDYTGCTRQELQDRYCIRPKQGTAAGRTILLDREVTDKFRMEELRIEQTCQTDYSGMYAVAIVLEGRGELEVKGELEVMGGQCLPVRRGDSLFIGADAGPLVWRCHGEALRVVICLP
ncbi:MAG: RmlC-like protein [Paenibacillaceae bacterium]|jgi:mannose-6-phosphate isomerase|nr:RmlC-like protein [Paenibacillaceae bacterium]